ncbi:MAG TPA: KH domain-containing protein [Solirubrobacteraceae bacterium]|jgi:hypothetical protein
MSAEEQDRDGDGGDRDDEAREGVQEGPGEASPTGELLAYLARGLVDRPEEVAVEQFDEDDGSLVLELSVGDDDYGKVIGRGGRTAHALRTVVRAAATHERRRVLIDIVD